MICGNVLLALMFFFYICCCGYNERLGGGEWFAVVTMKGLFGADDLWKRILLALMFFFIYVAVVMMKGLVGGG